MSISQESYDALVSRRAKILARINGWEEGDVGDKANSGQPGAIDHDKYMRGLYFQLEITEKLIVKYDASLNGGGEVLSEGRT